MTSTSDPAERMTMDLIGKTVGGWSIRRFINHGKSAAVFEAERNGQLAALKIFFPDIVKRYGHDKQLRRIERERTLIGVTHPNLVQILDGGQDHDLLFIAMEYFPGENLSLQLRNIPSSSVRSLISQVARAAKFLEGLAFAHRDIKPENIGLSPDLETAKLLDFGVIRPLDFDNVTDEGDQRYFVGTLQYSPPELLFRVEEQSVEAWRAITFYQLGGVLHDLLTHRQLFEAFKTPYARLVRAVEQEIPRIDAENTDADLRLLAQNCLAKNPFQRLNAVRWDDFDRPAETDPVEGARRVIAHRRVLAAQAAVIAPPSRDEVMEGSRFALAAAIESGVVNACKTESLPRYSTIRTDGTSTHEFRVLFEPSERDGLDGWLAVFCRGEIVDPSSNFFDLCVWAFLTFRKEDIPASPAVDAPGARIKGTLIEQDIRLHVHKVLMLVFATVLGAHATEGESGAWIRIGQLP